MATTRKTKTVTKKATRKPAVKARVAKPKTKTTRAAKAKTPRTPRAKTKPSENGKNPPPPTPPVDGRTQLQHERTVVENELEQLRAELLEAPEMTGDEVDLNVYEREKTLGLVTAFERRLEEIDAALRATAEGTYGTCQRCGKPIDPERLKIFPETRLCVSCKTLAEKEARRLRMQ